MASNWLYIDTQFPTFTGAEDTEEKISTIQNYLFMLVEQLRYTLHNLDMGNMNTAAMSGFSQMLTEPIYAMLSDEAGNIANLAATAERLSADMYGADGKVATLELTAAGLWSDMYGADGKVSRLAQTVDGFSLEVTNGAESSTIRLMSGSTVISSRRIAMTGMVTFNALETPGATTIDGGNITTGSISANRISGGTINANNINLTNVFSLYDRYGEMVGYMGCGYGHDTASDTTGAYLSSANTANYLIATDAGVRMQAGLIDPTKIYVVSRQAVIEAAGTSLVVNGDGVFVNGNRVLTE